MLLRLPTGFMLPVVSCALLLLIPFGANSQAMLCGGNLGNNIFSTGDFGSGSNIVYPVDPKLAPGFQYTTIVPPTDGRYTLTNDMSKWPTAFPTWIRIGDNSEDPKGYMMVINASHNPGIFYEQQIDNICENTLYEFSADVINLIKSGIDNHILPDVSFFINDKLMYTTGDIPQDEQWHSHGFTFTTLQGQSSLKLTLRNNAPGGGGNDLALDNISFRACGPDAMIELQAGGRFCESELPLLTAQIDSDTGFVQWQMSEDSVAWIDLTDGVDRAYQTHDLPPGKYYFRFLYATTLFNLQNSNCRVISHPIDFIVDEAFYTDSKIICEGLSWVFGDSIYSEAGFYQHAFPREGKCDSVVTFELILFPDPPIIGEYAITPPSCQGAADGSIAFVSVSGVETPYTFTINNDPASTTKPLVVPAGIYTAVITNEYGCYDEQDLVVPDGLPLQVKTIEDTTLLWGKRLSFSTSSNLPVTEARWMPSANLACPGCLSTEAVARENLTYIIEAETEGGCVAVDTVNIFVSHIPVRHVPNVFSPNNDGVNDAFEILIEPVSFRDFDQIVVMDRWGGVVHKQTHVSPQDYLRVWDGNTPKGPAGPGVYLYIIAYTWEDGSTGQIKGDVTVIN